MKRTAQIVLVLLMLIALAACAPSSAAGGEDPAQADGGDTAAVEGPAITNESAGQTLTLKVGDRVVVKLDAEYEWGLDSTPSMIFGEVADAQLAEGVLAEFEAKMPGKATFQASGKPVCAQAEPPCDDPKMQFTVNIEVTRE